MNNSKEFLSIIIFGASGDLVSKKIIPAFFSLYKGGFFSNKNKNYFSSENSNNSLDIDEFHIFGFARKEYDTDSFVQYVKEILCKHFSIKEQDVTLNKFLQHLSYVRGGYNDKNSFERLNQNLKERENKLTSNRIFYFAIPPSVFLNVAKSVKESAMSSSGWNRVIVEKPFGKDLESFGELNKSLSNVLDEDSIYRIDHYLGKEVIQNLLTLRFSNVLLEPIWNRNYINNIQIIWKEDIGTAGRGGYFDEYGIIRDVMQNHLIQILSLIAMEIPVRMDASSILDEKVKVLKAMPYLSLDNIALGQYGANEKEKGYLDDETVSKNSLTSTFASAVFRINNHRWEGVPFLLKCGKALDNKVAEVRIEFNNFIKNIYRNADFPSNMMIIRIQPDPGIFLYINSKSPGMHNSIHPISLDLNYNKKYENVGIPDAYEKLILDAIRGDKSLFIRDDELKLAWKILTPVLKEIDNSKIKPSLYQFGSRGPKESDELLEKYGLTWGD